MQRVVIIGAGISGLYLAMLLQKKFDIVILEARERIGGRAFTVNGHDLGPSWIWPHQKKILQLIERLELEIFSQYSDGYALYQSDTVQRFIPESKATSYRIRAGMGALCDALAKKLTSVDMQFSSTVIEIVQDREGLKVFSSDRSYNTDIVINTLPPRLASKLSYTPVLAPKIYEKLQNTPTWMGYIIKVVVSYKQAFWREEGLSGFAFSHTGPLGEIHDATTQEEAALFGFASVKNLSNVTEENIIDQLCTLFGEKARAYSKIYILNWNDEIYTATQEDKQILSAHPNYGYELCAMNDRLYFASTESSYDNGGYIEGALAAAEKIAQKLLS
ncbi:MAG: FAD-dependent oxidoreductase [Campylobacterales bacterium]|nr:FAD-dependent oxidoreductase [Campylobacterales bacterium]